MWRGRRAKGSASLDGSGGVWPIRRVAARSSAGLPQNNVGIALWSLSASATDWLTPEKLARLCSVPVIGVLEASWDLGSFAMESRVLRPLTWFGLLECRWERQAGLGEPRLYRKAPLFDGVFKFSVQVERPAVRH